MDRDVPQAVQDIYSVLTTCSAPTSPSAPPLRPSTGTHPASLIAHPSRHIVGDYFGLSRRLQHIGVRWIAIVGAVAAGARALPALSGVCIYLSGVNNKAMLYLRPRDHIRSICATIRQNVAADPPLEKLRHLAEAVFKNLPKCDQITCDEVIETLNQHHSLSLRPDDPLRMYDVRKKILNIALGLPLEHRGWRVLTLLLDHAADNAPLTNDNQLNLTQLEDRVVHEDRTNDNLPFAIEILVLLKANLRNGRCLQFPENMREVVNNRANLISQTATLDLLPGYVTTFVNFTPVVEE